MTLALGIGYGVYLFNLKPPDIREEKAVFEISAETLTKEFSENEAVASKKYVDKVLIVFGKVEEIKSFGKETSVLLSSNDPMSSVTCSFYQEETTRLKNINAGTKIKIKGKCTGKLMDVVLNNCSLVN